MFDWLRRWLLRRSFSKYGVRISNQEAQVMFKSGWKTTEFWITVLTIVVKVTGIVDLPVEAIAAVAAYVLSRGWAKSTQ